MPAHVNFEIDTNIIYEDLMAQFEESINTFTRSGPAYHCIDLKEGRAAFVFRHELIILMFRCPNINDWQIWMVAKNPDSNISVPEVYEMLISPLNNIGVFFTRILSDYNMTKGGLSIWKRLDKVKMLNVETGEYLDPKYNDLETCFGNEKYLYELKK